MPQDFTDCVKRGGRVVTQILKGNKYKKVCYDKSGKRYEGETRTKKKAKSFKKPTQIEQSRALVIDLRKLKEHFDENFRNK